MYKAELLIKKKAEIVYKNAVCEVGKIHFVSCPFGAPLSLKVASLKEIYTKTLQQTPIMAGLREQQDICVLREVAQEDLPCIKQILKQLCLGLTWAHVPVQWGNSARLQHQILSSSAMSLIFLRG